MTKRSVLMLSYPFPPAASAGVFRTLRFIRYLPEFGWKPVVLTVLPEALHHRLLDSTLDMWIPQETVIVRTGVLRPINKTRNALKSLRIRTGIEKPAAGLNGTTEQEPDRVTAPPRGMACILRAVGSICDTLFATPDGQMGWIWPATRAALRLVRQFHPDVLYSTGPPHSSHLIGIILKFLTRLPLVIDLRDPWARIEWKTEGNALSCWLQLQLEQLCVRWSDCIILNTSHLYDEFCSFYNESLHRKFKVIPNGYDPDLLCLAKQLMTKKEQRHDNGSIHLCHSGKIYGQRDLRGLATAIGHLVQSGQRVILEQIGVVEQTPALSEYLRAHHLEDCIQLRGQLSHKETLDRMAAADAFIVIQPNTSTQVPGKLLEMLPFCKPIIALTGAGATADIVERFDLGIVADPADYESISSAIVRVVNGNFQCTRKTGLEQALAAFDGRRLTGMFAQTLQNISRQNIS